MKSFLSELGVAETNSGVSNGTWITPRGDTITSSSPVDGSVIARVQTASAADLETIVSTAVQRFDSWRMLPAPQRGDIVRQLGNLFRQHKRALGQLIASEMGKIQSEGEGEVQEMIDIADFAVGLSRQLYGKTMHSERAQHRMYEQWHPLGAIGIITAFNFPGAVWAWNAMIAAVCGNTMVWKPSPEVPLTAIAIQHMCNEIMRQHDIDGVFNLVVGDVDPIGEALIADRRLPLISATGSCRMGRRVGQVVAARLGRSLLELGGNNAIVVMDDADLDMTVRAVVFGAVGTAGQRCTSTRRLLVHERLIDGLCERLVQAYGSVRIGDPLDAATLMGPLIHQGAVDAMMAALDRARAEGGDVLTGGRRVDRPGFFVEPTIVRSDHLLDVAREETFAPILYVVPFRDLDEALRLHNDVDQGLSSALFTRSLQHAETFLSHGGSDCGIANVNIGTSGAEIGGAFGGEKDTGGGRESGSDSWKAYMRRQTNTINWGSELPLAQGVRFDVG